MSHHTVSVELEDKPGALARVSQMFARRGYNILSLAVGPTERRGISRLTLRVDCSEHSLEQIEKQMHKLVNVLRVVELAHAVRTDELLERVEILRAADDLERERVAADVRDPRAEHLAERDQLGTLVRRGADGDQRQLPLDRLARAQLDHPQDVDELVHLLLDLLERVLGAVDPQRQARDVGPLGRADGEALDVVAAAREHLRHARERPRLVLELDRDRVLAHPTIRSPAASSSGSSMMSTDAAPAGTIG